MSELVGTSAIIRLILRRDRFILPVWILLVAGLALASAQSFAQLYPTLEARQAYAAEVAGTPAVVALTGPVFAASVGGLVAWRWTVQGIFFVGLANLLTIVRHTRADEEAGRRELLGSAVVGREAPLTAVLIVTAGANLLTALLVAGELVLVGLPSAGALALGLSVAAVGCTVGAATAVAAQLTQTPGAARGLAAAVWGILYLLRLIGDVSGATGGSDWLSWLSPMGWARFTRPFAGEQWWVFGSFVAASGCLIALAYALAARRDLGAGVLPDPAGPPVAGPYLSGPFGLAWRLHRSALVAWTLVCAVVGAAFGLVVTTVAQLLLANGGVADFFTSVSRGASPSDVVFHLYFLTFGPLIALYAIYAALRARAEEVSLRAEPVLAAAVSRIRWMSSHLLFASVGPLALFGALGLAAGLTYGLGSGDVGEQVPRALIGALVYLPAAWVLMGIAALQFGMLPRLMFLSWGAWLVFALVDFANERQLVDPRLYQLSPFAHVPNVLLGEPVVVAPLIVLLGIGALVTLAGLTAFARRDVG